MATLATFMGLGRESGMPRRLGNGGAQTGSDGRSSSPALPLKAAALS